MRLLCVTQVVFAIAGENTDTVDKRGEQRLLREEQRFVSDVKHRIVTVKKHVNTGGKIAAPSSSAASLLQSGASLSQQEDQKPSASAPPSATKAADVNHPLPKRNAIWGVFSQWWWPKSISEARMIGALRWGLAGGLSGVGVGFLFLLMAKFNGTEKEKKTHHGWACPLGGLSWQGLKSYRLSVPGCTPHAPRRRSPEEVATRRHIEKTLKRSKGQAHSCGPPTEQRMNPAPEFHEVQKSRSKHGAADAQKMLDMVNEAHGQISQAKPTLPGYSRVPQAGTSTLQFSGNKE